MIIHRDGETLRFFVVYENPSDFPGFFVVRVTELFPDGEMRVAQDPRVVASSLDVVRAGIPEGLVRLDRLPGDDPCIREVWL